MANYLLIESRDPFETNEVLNDYQLAIDLARAGNNTTLFLVQNGVLPTRTASMKKGLLDAIDNGVEILCDDFSLRERGISQDNILEGVQVTSLDSVVDQFADGAKTLWL